MPTDNLDRDTASKCVQSLTLRQLLSVITNTKELSDSQKKVIDTLLNADTLINTPFDGLALDSRKLQSGTSVDINDTEQHAFQKGFVLLKSQTQPLSASQAYFNTAKDHAAFILSEIDPMYLRSADASIDGTSRQINQSPIVFVPKIRDVLGILIQYGLLPSTVLKAIETGVSMVTDYLPKVVAVTGTNGKTTISQLIAQLCQLSSIQGLKHSAVMGTAGNGRLNSLVQASHTTGDALAVQTFLKQMSDEDIDVLALEASSHGLDQHRLQGVPISVAVYTNLSRDHLDYHPSMQAYAEAKARLFDRQYFPDLTHAIINLDDEFASLMIDTAKQSEIEIWTYSLNSDADATLIANNIKPTLEGVSIELASNNSNFGSVWLDSPLLGRFNVANLLAAVAAAVALGVPFERMPDLVSQLEGANGRMQRVFAPDSTTPQGCFIVDYAHTPDALTQVLTSLKPHCSGKLWAVFGCGGDRDSGKRPLMAKAGLALADEVILTSDNPRSEDPVHILEDMQQGMDITQRKKTDIIIDRRDAIKAAVNRAGPEDIVVIAGKGHETYQEVNGVRYDFDDVAVLQDAFITARQHSDS